MLSWTVGLFPPFGDVDDATMNMNVQISLRDIAIRSLEYMSRNGVAVANGNSVFTCEDAQYCFPPKVAIAMLHIYDVVYVRMFHILASLFYSIFRVSVMIDVSFITVFLSP